MTHLVRKSRGTDGAAETACGVSVKRRRTTFIPREATCLACLQYERAPWIARRDSEIPPPRPHPESPESPKESGK